MTVFRAFHARRSDRLRVHSLDHVGPTVPDLDEARRSHSTFGQTVAGRHGGSDVRANDGDHVWRRIDVGSIKQIPDVSFGAFVADSEWLAVRLDALEAGSPVPENSPFLRRLNVPEYLVTNYERSETNAGIAA